MDKKTKQVIEEYKEAAKNPLGSYTGITDDDEKPTQDADDL